jgi:hypothetical protein
MSSKANARLDCGYCILEFPRGAAIPSELYLRLKDAGFYRMGAKYSNDFVATPPKDMAGVFERTAQVIASDFNQGKYREKIGGNIKRVYS